MSACRWFPLIAMLAAATAAADEPAAIDFNSRIAPIFQQYCLGCHNATDAEHGLVLESYDALLKGGDDGAVLVPGKGDDSRLLRMVDGRAKPLMPPEGNERPTADEIALLKSWIDVGAKGPSGEAPDPTLLVTPKVKLLATPRRVINAAAISPDGKLAALAGYREVRLVATDNRATVRTLSGHRGNVTRVAFTADGSFVLTAAGEPGLFGEVKLWNMADGAAVRAIVGHRDALYAAALNPDGGLIATGGYDQVIKLWDAATGQEMRTIAGHNGAVFDLAFSPNGKLLASASGDRTVKLWDVASGERLDTFGQPLKEVYAVAFSPDGRRLAAGGVDNRIRVWQISETAQEGTNPLVITRFAHEGAIVALAYSRDGALLATSAEDRTVRVWDSQFVIERQSLESQPDWPLALAWGKDDHALLVGRLDGTLAIYDAATGQAVPPPKPELAALSPRGVHRGTKSKLKLTGKNLLDASGVQLTGQPIAGQIAARVVPAEAPAADELSIEVTPAADLPRGTYQLAVVTPGGTSPALPLEIDDLVQATEIEPNHLATETPIVALPLAIWGVVAARGDIDHTRFEAKAGQTIVCELAARRFGSALNAVLTLLDPAGQVVAVNNDFDGQEDPLLAYRVPSDGCYTVRVNDQAHNGSDKHFYRLSLGELPYVTGCFPVGVPANQESEVELAGYNLPPGTKVKVPASPPGEASVPIELNGFRIARPVKVLAAADSELIESEPNDTPAEATAIVAPGAVNGRIWARGAPPGEAQGADQDLFRFESQVGRRWVIETEGQRRGSPVDTRIEVLDVEGRPVTRALLQAVRDSYLEFRGVDSNAGGLRPKNWEEMELNEYVYVGGEVCKIFRMPQGPDSEVLFYTLGGRRRTFFDTSSTSHALGDPLYTVEPHEATERLIPNGLPVFPIVYANDDDSDHKLGRDSKLEFTAPAAGTYLVRVGDVRDFGGDRFVYRLVVREPRPDFQVSLADVNPTVSAGSGRRLSFNAERRDGFDGDITIDLAGLPPGFTVSTPLTIESGHFEARAVLLAAADAVQPPPEAWGQVKIMARAEVDGRTVEKEVNPLGQVTLAEKPNLLVRVEPAELTIVPGTTITALLKVERNGFDDLVTFDVDNLPHGVIVDNIGLNGVLIPAGASERQIFLTCAKWVPDIDRRFQALASNAGGQASPSVTLHVRRPGALAKE